MGRGWNLIKSQRKATGRVEPGVGAGSSVREIRFAPESRESITRTRPGHALWSIRFIVSKGVRLIKRQPIKGTVACKVTVIRFSGVIIKHLAGKRLSNHYTFSSIIILSNMRRNGWSRENFMGEVPEREKGRETETQVTQKKRRTKRNMENRWEKMVLDALQTNQDPKSKTR